MQLYDEIFCISIQILQKHISKGPIDITPELVRVIMQWLDAKHAAEVITNIDDPFIWHIYRVTGLFFFQSRMNSVIIKDISEYVLQHQGYD